MSPKVIFLFLSIAMLINQSVVNGTKLECQYRSSTGFYGLDGQNVYNCVVKDNKIFTNTRVTIDSVEGEHEEHQTNADVTGVEFDSIPSLKFFPHNLQNVFGDLLVIRIYFTDLQEIRQEDIKIFPKLRHLYLGLNRISTIDADLFIFNSELRFIALNSNQISHIDPNVFDHLNNLVYLRLSDNKCKKDLSDAEDSRSEVLQLIQRVRNDECSS